MFKWPQQESSKEADKLNCKEVLIKMIRKKEMGATSVKKEKERRRETERCQLLKNPQIKTYLWFEKCHVCLN